MTPERRNPEVCCARKMNRFGTTWVCIKQKHSHRVRHEFREDRRRHAYTRRERIQRWLRETFE